MTREFDIVSIFENVFGFRPKPYHIEGGEVHQPETAKGGSLDKNKLSITAQQDMTRYSGTPYYDTYKEVDTQGNAIGNREIFLPAWLDDYMLPFPVIGISNRKNIVETVMIHRNGTVKELISTEDYKINIKGIIVREDGTYPEEEIRTLRTIYENNAAVYLKSALTDFFLLNGDLKDKVVITDLNFPLTVGVQNAKAYEMNVVSDQVFELYIN